MWTKLLTTKQAKKNTIKGSCISIRLVFPFLLDGKPMTRVYTATYCMGCEAELDERTKSMDRESLQSVSLYLEVCNKTNKKQKHH